MAKMLTTKDVQNILHIDRSTVYRMVESGRLPGVKVGKQWRFPADQIDRWLQQQQTGSTTTLSAETNSNCDFAVMLPLTCTQLIQDAFAEALGVMIIITDMAGNPVTEVSNPCGLYTIVSTVPNGLQKCIIGWRDMANMLNLEPKLAPSHLGLLGTRGLVRNGTALNGMVVMGGIAPAGWPPSDEAVESMAAELGLKTADLVPHLDEVFYLNKAQQAVILSQVQRIANILTHIIAERTALTDKLNTIAKLATVS